MGSRITPGRCRIEGMIELVVAMFECWHCRAPMNVASLAVPPGAVARTLDLPEGRETALAMLVSGVSEVRCPIVPSSIVSSFRRASRQTEYSNFCPSCSSRVGDFYLYLEPDSPFFGYPRSTSAIGTTADLVASHPLGTGVLQCAEPYAW